MAYTNPQQLHDLLDELTDYMIDYLHRQIDSGVDMIQIFESWAGEVTPHMFREFIAPRLARLTANLPDHITKTLYMKNTALYLEQVATLGFDILSIDWKHNLKEIWNNLQNIPNNTIKALQGNLDPDILTVDNDILLEKEVKNIIKTARDNKINLIFNLGHGITPKAIVNNVELLCNIVHNS